MLLAAAPLSGFWEKHFASLRLWGYRCFSANRKERISKLRAAGSGTYWPAGVTRRSVFFLFFFCYLPPLPSSHPPHLHPNFPTSVIQHLLCHPELLLIRATGLLKVKCWRRSSCYLLREEWSHLWRHYQRPRFAFPKYCSFRGQAKKMQKLVGHEKWNLI